MNRIRAITWHEGLRAFDVEEVGLRQESFVAGADTVLDQMSAEVPNA